MKTYTVEVGVLCTVDADSRKRASEKTEKAIRKLLRPGGPVSTGFVDRVYTIYATNGTEVTG